MSPSDTLRTTDADGVSGVSGVDPPPGVSVAPRVERALALVEEQLIQQAAATTVVPAPNPMPAPIAPEPVPAPVPRGRAGNDQSTDEVELYADSDAPGVWERPRRRSDPLIDTTRRSRDERHAPGRLQARKVRRIIRHVSPWSVFKVSIFFYLSLWLVLMVAGVVLWRLADSYEVITNIEKFYAKATGERIFEIDGRGVFRAGAAAGAILVFAATAFTVMLSILFNLVTDLTGGIRVSVIELESVRRDARETPARRRSASRPRRSVPMAPPPSLPFADKPAPPIGYVPTAAPPPTNEIPVAAEVAAEAESSIEPTDEIPATATPDDQETGIDDVDGALDGRPRIVAG